LEKRIGYVDDRPCFSVFENAAPVEDVGEWIFGVAFLRESRVVAVVGVREVEDGGAEVGRFVEFEDEGLVLAIFRGGAGIDTVFYDAVAPGSGPEDEAAVGNGGFGEVAERGVGEGVEEAATGPDGASGKECLDVGYEFEKAGVKG
jgi:hypothetical protein